MLHTSFFLCSHEVADVAGLTSFSFGQEEIDRYVMLWKKVFYYMNHLDCIGMELIKNI